MNSRGRFWLIVAVVITALGGVFYSQIEWVEKEVDIGEGDEASRNDFLAAELFLRELGIETETVTGMALLDDLPSTDDLLLLSASRESLSIRRRDALIEWVESGGELLVVAEAVFDPEKESSGDPLLDELGIFLLSPDEEDEEDESDPQEEPFDETEAAAEGQEEREAEDSGEVDTGEHEPEDALGSFPKTVADLLGQPADRATCEEDPARLTEVATAEGASLFLELASMNGLGVYNERIDEAYFSSGGQMMSLPIGEGRVIALTSIDPLLNWRIHCHDHAYFLWFAAGDRAKVWLLHDPDVPSLARLAWTRLPASMVGGLILLFLVGAAASLRFGVASTEYESPRRELREHLEASVTFHFRKGGFAELFSRLRKDLIRGGPPDRDRWAERAGVTAGDAHGALVEAVPWKRREILRRVQTMLRMRRTK